MSTLEDPLIGKVLSGRFEIVSPIGVGGMGRVYRAVQRPLDRIVALKVLNPRYDGSKDPGFEKRFFLEASMTAKLKHPNTITVHDYGRTDDGIYYIAMEYAEGDTLQQILQQGPLTWPRALFIAAQIARSLREAHKLGLVHRDLKPANIILMNEGSSGDIVKVLDFGLVKSFMTEVSLDPSVPGTETEITQAGVLLGSPMYMAPEQARNEADPRTDIYALGVLMFQCIAGRTPFLGKESIDIIVKHIREAPPELRTLVPEVPFEVNTLIMKCLEKTPDARFQNMDELLEAMRVATSGQGMSGIFVDPRTYTNTGGLPRTSTPGNHLRPPVQQATPSAGLQPPPGSLEPNEVSVEFELSGEQPARRGWLVAGIAGVVVLGAAVGGIAAFKSVSRNKPATDTVLAPQPRPVLVRPTPEAVKVTFDVTSEPSGATVIRGGTVVGTTPLALPVERTGDSPAQIELAFALDGYEGSTVVAQGIEGSVPVHQVLARKAAAAVPPPVSKGPGNRKKPPKPEHPPGYKDDPYQ